MLEDSSNQELLTAWQSGSQAAAQVLVRRYMLRLTALARTHLSRRLSRRVDADDVVMSAWRSFFVAVDQQRVRVPSDDDLWPLLVTMTLRKLSRQAAHHSAARRSINTEAHDTPLDWQEAVTRDPTPRQAALIADQLESLMSRLSATDRSILTRRLQGDTLSAAATALDCSERTVRRSLQRIREEFLQMDVPDEPTTIDSTVSDVRSRPEPDSAADSTPTFTLDDLLLQELVGSGAFGKVYRSQCHSKNCQVAVKFLRRHLWTDRRASVQLIREFERMQLLRHPGIARTFGWGRSQQGATFVVMEWIDGHSLMDDRSPKTDDIAGILRCGQEISQAAAAAHQAGVIHGDLTPANVLQSNRGYLLTDFGFSQASGSRRTDILGGTPGFLAPEQRSEAFGAISPRTDVFGLGGILYFLLTGRPPVAGQNKAEIIANTLMAAPVPSATTWNSTIPTGVARLTEQCLQKEPAARPADTNIVHRELLRLEQET